VDEQDEKTAGAPTASDLNADAGPMLYHFENPHRFAQKRYPLLRPML